MSKHSILNSSGIPATEIQKFHQICRKILIDTMYSEYSNFYNTERSVRIRLIESNIKIKQVFKSEKEKVNSRINFNLDKNCNSNDMIIMDETEVEQVSSPFDKISDNINTEIPQNFMEIINSRNIPKGVYVYPTRESFRTEENLEIKHMVKIDNFAKFEEVLEKIRTDLEEAYIDYPHNKEENEIIKNGNFLIWTLLKSLLNILYKEDYPFFSANQVVFKLISTLSEILRKKQFYIYKLSSEFFNNFTKKLKLEKSVNLTPVISKYRKLYCKICYMYFCKRHLYTFYHYENIDGLKIYKKELINQSGNLIFSKKTKQKDIYLISSLTAEAPTSIDNLYSCQNFRDCRLNCEHNSGKFKNFSKNQNCREYDYSDMHIDQSSQEREHSEYGYYMTIFSHLENKLDFYLLINLVNKSFPIMTNSCYITAFFFQSKSYKCHFIDKIINILRNERCSLNIINSYLNSDKLNQGSLTNNNFSNFSNINSFSSSNFHPSSEKISKKFKFPSIESEKLKENFQPDISVKKPLKNKNSKAKLIDVSYTLPCNHAGICTRETCECIERRGVCEKFCGCAGNCSFQYTGCNCKDDCSMHEKDASCPCAYNQRECDPDICFCKSNVSVMNKEEFSKISNRHNLCRNIRINFNIVKKTCLSPSVLCPYFMGLFALENISENDLVCEYVGELLTKEETDRRTIFNDKLGLNYLFDIDEKSDIDAYRVGNEMRYVNHSSFGFENCYAKTMYVRGDMRIVLYAKRNIKRGEELYFDYKFCVNLPWLNKYNRYYGNLK